MSLVAYASSDSEEEQEDDTSSCAAPVPKKARETVKITIPSLQEFKEEDGKSQPKVFKSKSGSGLFSMLPPPKHSTSSTTESFKPHILTKKKETKPSAARKNIAPKQTTNPLSTESTESDPEDDNSAPVVDYFSFGESSSKYEVPQIESSLFSSLPKPVQSTEVYGADSVAQGKDVYRADSVAQGTEVYEAASSSQEMPLYSHASSDEAGSSQSWDENYPAAGQSSAQASFINDEGFKKIKGRRDTANINIIDINGGDQLTGKEQWLMKNLTEETAPKSSSKKRHGMPTQQQKRKHQITYLAFQARERELDLKNQWSLNSLTRRETQAKYGF